MDGNSMTTRSPDCPLKRLMGAAMYSVPATEGGECVVDALQVLLDLLTKPGFAYHSHSVGSHQVLQSIGNLYAMPRLGRAVKAASD